MTNIPQDEDRIPTKSFFELISKRSLVHAMALFLLLVLIVAARRRSGPIIRGIAETFAPPPPRASKRAPPTIRLAPLPGPAK